MFFIFFSFLFNQVFDGKFLRTDILKPADTSYYYDVRKYAFNIFLPMDNGYFSCKEVISLKSNILTDTLSFHFVNLICDSVKLENRRQNFRQENGYLKIQLDRNLMPNELIDLEIYYHRENNVPNLGFYFYRRSGNTLHNIAYTCTEPYDSRYWFCCFDEPWEKAERGVLFEITCPDSYFVCCNGILDSIKENQDFKTYFWSHSYPISTYLIHFACSKYATFSHWYHNSPNDSFEIKYFIWPEDSLRAVSSFNNVPLMIQFFSDTNMYGIFPFEKYGMDAVYPFMWGGMEHQTMTTIHRQWVTQGSEGGIAHELSHQWWGDMVTCFSFADIWLNEGFATYSDALYLGFRNGRDYFKNLMDQRAQYYFSEDASYRRPLYNPPLEHLFDYGHTYCKASWILHMLRYLMEDTSFTERGIFFRGLRAYRDSFAYRNANTEDLKRILSQVSGINLERFFDQWIYQAGYPKYTIYYSFQGNQVNLTVSQNNGANAPETFIMPISFKFNLANGETVITVINDTNPQNYTFYFSSSPISLVFDPENWLLKQSQVVSLNEEEYKKLREINIFALFVRKKDLLKKDYEIYQKDGRKVKINNIRKGLYFLKIKDQYKKIFILN
ncbi:MAG: M1 family metallopeptidase [candidate division WOR-3 bacterium]